MNRWVWLFSLALAIGSWVLPGRAADEGQGPAELYAGDRLDAARGGQVYRASCAECHDTGKGGAPRLQDTDAWQQRLFQAFSVMNSHAKSGFLGMPARGGNPTLTPADIADAVYYMTQILQNK